MVRLHPTAGCSAKASCACGGAQSKVSAELRDRSEHDQPFALRRVVWRWGQLVVVGAAIREWGQPVDGLAVPLRHQPKGDGALDTDFQGAVDEPPAPGSVALGGQDGDS